MRTACRHGLMLLVLTAAAIHSQVASSYNFDDGQIPFGTMFPTASDSSGNAHNPGAGVANAGGFNNSGMLVMTAPASGQTFSQWQLPDFAGGQSITNLNLSFNVFMGGPVSGGNGMLFHWGPGLLYQYTGGAGSFGQGLDVTLRTYNSPPNTSGINIYNGGTSGPNANSPVAASSFMGYYRGGVTNFASNTWVNLNIVVTNAGAATNAILNLVCSNGWNGLTNIYSNLVISNFTRPLTHNTRAFSATDGSGAHEYCYLDNVDFTVNGTHIGGNGPTNPVTITGSPQDQAVLEGATVTFSVTINPASTGPIVYQWWRIAGSVTNTIPDATNANHTTPTLTTNDSGAQFYVVVSGALNTVTSSVAILTVVPQGQPDVPATYNFDDGQTPAGTSIRGNNIGLGVANAGGFQDTGCLILTRPGSGQTYGQWVITNDLAGGVAVSSFNISFKLYMGHGSGGNVGVPNPGGSGMVFHLGPTPPNQLTGNDSSWGNGLDVTFRTYGSTGNSVGVNVEYNQATNVFNPGGGTQVAYTGFFGYFQTNGAADSFSEAVDVWMSLVNGRLNLVCSNALIGCKVVYTNLDIPAFAPISPGCVAFTAGDGGGAHEDAWIDNVNILLNSCQPTGPAGFTDQPDNQVARVNDPVTFAAGATGSPPISYQWKSNNVPIPGATNTSYTTPPAGTGMNGAVYSVTASNSFGSADSSNATLRVLPSLNRTLVWNDEFNGTQLDGSKWKREGDVTRQQGYWMKMESYLNGRGQLTLRVRKDETSGHYGAGGVQTGGLYQPTFGYFEAKVKFPTQQGHWCAFWVYSDSQGSTNVIGGADGAEMDIMEKAWLTDHIQHALHWDGYGANSGSAGLQVRNMGMNDGGWHIFGFDWTPTNYAFYVDGTLTYSTNAGGVSQVPSYIRLTEEIGNFGTGPDVWGTGPITNATLPDYYLVDYVRVYDTNQWIPPAITTQPQSTNVPAGAPATFTVVVTNNATAPLSYQWWKIVPGISTNAISAATNASYTTPVLSLADKGEQFYVVITNVMSSVTSLPATLTVTGLPGFGAVMFDNGSLTMTWTNGGTLLTATNLALPAWQWTVVTGATSPYVVTNFSPAQQFYRVKQ